MDFGPKNCIFGSKICIFLRYTYETPILLAWMDPTQWDHKSPISWGNSGYLWFSSRWPFGCSAVYFSAPIVQSDPFKAKNTKMNKNHFFYKLSSNKFRFCGKQCSECYLLPLFASFFVHFHKLIRRPPGPLCVAPPPRSQTPSSTSSWSFCEWNKKQAQWNPVSPWYISPLWWHTWSRQRNSRPYSSFPSSSPLRAHLIHIHHFHQHHHHNERYHRYHPLVR